jgi:hypothetical protein
MLSEKRKTANRFFQRQHKEKMYDAGFKQRVIWVKRDEADTPSVLNLDSFLKAFRRLVRNIPKEKRQRLFKDILSMAEYAARQDSLQGGTHGK